MAVLLIAVVSVKSPKSVSTVKIRLLHSGCRFVSVHRFKLHLHLLSIRFISTELLCVSVQDYFKASI